MPFAFDENKAIHNDVGLACKPFTREATNNVAEYTALIKALQWSVDNQIKAPEIFGDSKLTVYQTNNEWKVKSSHLKSFVMKAHKLMTACEAKLTWILREQNHADRLTQEYYKKYAKEHGITKQSTRDRHKKSNETNG